MLQTDNKQEAIGWRQSYELLKKKAMEQELSWSGLIVSLSIAFFVIALSAGLLRLTYQSIEQKSVDRLFNNSEKIIQLNSLAQLDINKFKNMAPPS